MSAAIGTLARLSTRAVKRERELEHDVQVYRAFEREAERLEEDAQIRKRESCSLRQRNDTPDTTSDAQAVHTRSENGGPRLQNLSVSLS